MTDHPKITGARHVATLPDNGPWRLTSWMGEVLIHSEISGLWTVNGEGCPLQRVAVPWSGPLTEMPKVRSGSPLKPI